MKKISILILSVIILGACSSTNILTLSVVEPAPVSLPGSFKRVGILHRTNVDDENKIINKIERVLTAESKTLDIDGAKECLLGLQDELLSNQRFEEIKVLDHITLSGPGMGIMPAPLTQDEVYKICNANELDGLFVLESYDTDNNIDYSTAPAPIKTPLGVIPATEHTATMHTEIKTGWRIYDPMASNVIDEFQVSDFINSTGRGLTPMAAAKALVGRKEAVKKVSNNVGHAYALRILPFSIRVARNYYVRGSNNFKIAKRKARTGNWDEAAVLWKEEINNPKRKIAGRAHYNMAIINEINGNLDLAIDWAQKAYENFNIRKALYYVNILKDRQYRNNLLQNQQQESER